jgi:hypothetical protein
MSERKRQLVRNEEGLRTATALKAELLARVFGPTAASLGHGLFPPDDNIVGVGYGVRTSGGKVVSDDPTLRVYVRSKKAASSMSRAERIPARINGTATDVIDVGEIVACALPPAGPQAAPRPTSCGVSVGHPAVKAGTLGCLVRRIGVDNGERFILSCCHVLVDLNAPQLGDEIWQPGSHDGGQPPPIARLAAYKQIDFGSGPNAFDAAIARLDNPAHVTEDILEIGRVRLPLCTVAAPMVVKKRGRTTKLQSGVVTDIAADVSVGYQALSSQRATFEGQIVIQPSAGKFADGGDSGSLCLNDQCAPFGLLFAASSNGIGFANPLVDVLGHFGVDIL